MMKRPLRLYLSTANAILAAVLAPTCIALLSHARHRSAAVAVVSVIVVLALVVLYARYTNRWSSLLGARYRLNGEGLSIPSTVHAGGYVEQGGLINGDWTGKFRLVRDRASTVKEGLLAAAAVETLTPVASSLIPADPNRSAASNAEARRSWLHTLLKGNLLGSRPHSPQASEHTAAARDSDGVKNRRHGRPTLPACAALTRFVGRATEVDELTRLVADKRLVTLIGAGGVGKTRLAARVAYQVAGASIERVCFVDLSPVTDPGMVPAAIGAALGIGDQLGAATIESVAGFIGERRVMMVLDTCEHLLDASARSVFALLRACPELTVLATSREPIGTEGEIIWRVAALSLADEAPELFADRAALTAPAFAINEDNAQLVRSICVRLDGIPLAIELAAARVSSLSLAEIADGLEDRLRLLTAGARVAVPRQKTLRASLDWSHALLSEGQAVLLRRLAIFPASFDLTAARAVAADADIEPDQVVSHLVQLIDKSLVMAEHRPNGTRYRLAKTERLYAAEKLAESGEATALHARHCHHYMELAVRLDTAGRGEHKQLAEQATSELDNLRAAFAWNRESGESAKALDLASRLQAIWFGQGRLQEGLTWFASILGDTDPRRLEVPAGVLARGLVDKVLLHTWLANAPIASTEIIAAAQRALRIARQAEDPVLLARALTACGSCSADADTAQAYLAEATELARALDAKWTLSQILYWEMLRTYIAGQPAELCAAAHRGLALAESIGDRFIERQCRLWLGVAQLWTGDLGAAITCSRKVTEEAQVSTDAVTRVHGLYIQARALAYSDPDAAHFAATCAVEAAAQLGGAYQSFGIAARTCAALAAGDLAAVVVAGRSGLPIVSAQHDLVMTHRELLAQSCLASGDLISARRIADDAVMTASGWHLMAALTIRARVALGQDEPEQAHDDLHAALACGAEIQAHLGMPDALELLAGLLAATGRHEEAARLFGAASAWRQRMGQVRFGIWQADYNASVSALRAAMDGREFQRCWTEGTAMSSDEAILSARLGRRRGKRRRPTRGWESLTPAERNIVALVSEGLDTKGMAARLFVSVRTVHTHLTHIYAKLGINSRSQLVEEATRHA